MLHIKLQLASLILVLYLNFIYLWQTHYKNIKCSPYYDGLMLLAFFTTAFDGITAYTVNTPSFPLKLNLFLHFIFYILLLSFMVNTFYYIIDQCRIIPSKKRKLIFLLIPFIIALSIITIFMPKTQFIHGKNTNYSYGIPVFAVYITLQLYYILTFLVTILNRKNIREQKRVSFISFLAITGIIITIQAIYPELLISSLVPAFTLISLYISIEDPAIMKLERINENTVKSFATLVESRDLSTGDHIKRTQYYVKIIINKLLEKNVHRINLTKDFIENLINAAPMHDIGKISVPDAILQKPGKLTDEEFSIMKRHSAIGGDIIIETFKDLENKDFLAMSYKVALYHHEKWNGTGYPEGLKGTQIPFAARIMSIADVFDAVSADRCYRKALPLDVCFNIIKEGAGKDFDPELVKLFLDARKDIEEVYYKSKEK